MVLHDTGGDRPQHGNGKGSGNGGRRLDAQGEAPAHVVNALRIFLQIPALGPEQIQQLFRKQQEKQHRRDRDRQLIRHVHQEAGQQIGGNVVKGQSVGDFDGKVHRVALAEALAVDQPGQNAAQQAAEEGKNEDRQQHSGEALQDPLFLQITAAAIRMLITA